MTDNPQNNKLKIQGRIPAEATLKYMEKQTQFNEKINLSMNDMQHEIKDLATTITTSNNKNAEQHKQIFDRLGRIEKFILAILVIFALAALYYIFSAVGLPKP